MDPRVPWAGRKLGELCSEVVSPPLVGQTHTQVSSVSQVKATVTSVSKICPRHWINVSMFLCVCQDPKASYKVRNRDMNQENQDLGGLPQKLGGAPMCAGI